MCIGTPMQVIESSEHCAIVDDGGTHHQVGTALVGPQVPGTWLLIFLGDAREVMDEDNALKTREALQAVSAIMQGDKQIEHLFTDLINREPQLPPHLQAPTKPAIQESSS